MPLLHQGGVLLTLPVIHGGGSWFNEGACPMNTATHNVEVPFPQAFASPLAKRSPFPSAPRYGYASLHQADRPPTVRWECALRRGSTLSICQVAHAKVDTLVLLPVGTIYHGTQRNTLLLSVCNGLEQVYYKQAEMSNGLAWRGVSPYPKPQTRNDFSSPGSNA